MERVVILALGSRGDVEPCIALASALRGEGYEVVIAALEDFRELITSVGVGFASLRASLPRPFLAPPVLDWAMAHAHRHQLIAVEGVQLWLRSIATDVADATMSLIRPSDVIISGILMLDCALALRSALGCRLAVALFAPSLPTRHGPSLSGAIAPTRTSVFNRWSGAVTWSAGVRWSYPSGAIVRRALGLPLRRASRIVAATPDVPVLLAATTLLVPPAADWPSRVWLTGPWAPASYPEWVPPNDLLEFLERRPTPLFVEFGSVGHPSDIQLIVDASRRAGVRIVTGLPRGSGAERGIVDRDIYVVGETPHAWLFSQVAGVIHHGSAGTTATALQAGVPSAAVPHQFDQNYYARRLSLLGVGPAAVARRRLDHDRLADLMKAITTGPAVTDYRMQAQRVARKAVRESGTAEAIRVMHSEGVL